MRLPREAVRAVSILPSDTATPEGRARERNRRALLSSASSFVEKAASGLTLLISVPMTIHYLGVERYGMWMTIASVVAMLSYADLGIGNGLLNAVSSANGRDDVRGSARSVSSAFFMLAGVSVVVLTLSLLVYRMAPWQRWFHIGSPQAIQDCGPTFLVLIGCFCASLPLGITQRIENGYQQGYVANLWNAMGSVVGLAAVATAIRMRAALPWLVAAMAGAPIFAAALNSVWLFSLGRPCLRPRLQHACLATARELFGAGMMFFILQLSLAVGFQSDNVVLAALLGAGRVAQYAVATRMFSFVPLLLTFMVMPLWPAYGEAFARGDVAWIKRTLIRSLVSVLAVVLPINAALAVAGDSILRLWVGPEVAPAKSLLVLIAISQTLTAMAVPVSVFLNALNVLRWQAICFASMACANIALSIYLTKHIGVPGVVCGSIIAQFLFWICPALLFLPKLLKSLQPRPAIALQSGVAATA